MCRLLAVQHDSPIDVRDHLSRFADISRNSREFQGHGWGCVWWDESGIRQVYKNIKPVWEDDLSQFPSARLILAHARSAYRDEGITIDNNMPFFDDETAFIFNGELHGVRIKEDGRIGAEKIYRYIMRFQERGLKEAIEKGAMIITQRSRYVRAMNILLTDGETVFIRSQFGEDPDYFTMHRTTGDQGERILCSDPWPGTSGWSPIPVNEVQALS